MNNMLQVVYETCTGLKAYDSQRKNEELLVSSLFCYDVIFQMSLSVDTVGWASGRVSGL